MEPPAPGRLLEFSDPAPNDLPELITDDDRLPVGAELGGRYVVLDAPEESSMSLVYRALDRQRRKAGDDYPYVALKVAPAAGDDDMAAHLRREFLKLAKLHHPNVVAAYDLSSDRGVEFMVLEWLGGRTLAVELEELTSKRLALRSAQEIIESVASALAHAHAAGIVHGDVKPSNVFLTAGQGVKLFDFGATTAASAEAEQPEDQSWATRAYASPEVLQGRTPQPRDDVYALGVVAYRLLAGQWPFGDADAQTARERGLVAEELPEDASMHWPAVQSALAFEPLDRPRDAAEFLERFLDDTVPAPQPASAMPTLADVARIEWGALATVAWGLLVWWMVADSPEPPRAEVVDPQLAAAAAAYEDGRLLEPPEDNAVGHYRAILERDPDNAAAASGLEDVAEVFLARSRAALAAGDLEAAVVRLDTARRIEPDHIGIAAMEDLVARFRRDLLVSARDAAVSDVEVADRYLERAAALSNADDPTIALARDELRQRRAAAEIAGLIDRIDQRILSERLLLPRGDSAMDLVTRAIALSPDNREVRLAEDRLTSALLFQAMFSISNGNLDAAEEFIDAARTLDVEHLATARAEYELAKARSNALRQRNQPTRE